MTDDIKIIEGSDGNPVVTVRLRFDYHDDGEKLLAALRELQREVIRREYRRDV